MKSTVSLNRELNVCVERTTAPNKHFLLFSIPADEMFTGSKISF